MYGGLAQLGGNASGNTVTISGGTINKYVYGGSADSGTASNNTVNIYGGTFKSDTRLYGGFSDDSSGNTGNQGTDTCTGSAHAESEDEDGIDEDIDDVDDKGVDH